MRAQILIPLIFGLAGAVVLISLGVWQMQRLTWKEAILADIESRISADPVALPANPDPEQDRYLPVQVEGRFSGPELHVLVSRKSVGAGYRIIQGFESGGRRILVDRGFVRLRDKDRVREQGQVILTGNLHWPDEVDGYTPDPDREANIWFARDVPVMAQALDTEEVLLIVSDPGSETGTGLTPLPVDTASIPNDHLNYVITWFSLAVIWIVMTLYYLRRTRRPRTKA